ncbi:MAG: hypothetical protein LBO21_03780, partial [Synergistaceae bacterium]|nr:hypothetical protein [Synergistaceae bacterium]
MREDEIKAVESVLFEYPAMCMCLKMRSEYLVSLVSLASFGGSGEIGPVDGGLMIPDQIKILERKERDPGFLVLSAVVERIFDAVNNAPAETREIITRLFFMRQEPKHAAAETNSSISRIYRKKLEAVKYMSAVCIGIYPAFCRWRAERDEEEAENMRLRYEEGKTRGGGPRTPPGAAPPQTPRFWGRGG